MAALRVFAPSTTYGPTPAAVEQLRPADEVDADRAEPALVRREPATPHVETLLGPRGPVGSPVADDVDASSASTPPRTSPWSAGGRSRRVDRGSWRSGPARDGAATVRPSPWAWAAGSGPVPGRPPRGWGSTEPRLHDPGGRCERREASARPSSEGARVGGTVARGASAMTEQDVARRMPVSASVSSRPWPPSDSPRTMARP